jgi:subfamily B ATP-binding cassette protein MsbA
MAEPQKKKIRWSAAWGDARELVWTHRRRLLLGAVLMLINQAMGLVLPASTKFLIDQVIVKGQTDLLEDCSCGGSHRRAALKFQPVAGTGRRGAAGHHRNAQKVQAPDRSFAGQLFRLDTVGKLISRIMNDAEGIRNLVGTGLVLVGSFITAAVSLCFWLNGV